MQHHPNRRRWIQGTATALGAAAVAPQLFAQTGASGPVKIGYAIARTGPWAAGAQVSQEPNYLLWAEQVNAAGGLSVKGVKRPIELIGYDDRSETETCVRTFEKLMGSDKVDLVLPPWGSGANFAVAPLANRFGYPLLAPTALSRKLIDMRLPFFFSLLQQPDKMMGALVDMLVAQNVKTLTIVYMDDLFGLENFAALNNALKKTGIQVLDRKSYPLGVKDLAPVLRTMKDLNPDAFIGITYPPDTILASRQAREVGFNPKYFYASVGTAFQLYKNVMAANTEGVIGMGGPADPAAGRGEGGPGPQGAARADREERVQDHPRADPLRGQRERVHSGHGVAMAGQRLRGGLAEGPRHRAAQPQAGLEVRTCPFPDGPSFLPAD
jgi:branched-chain amino acid transport system substrate-binding protein